MTFCVPYEVCGAGVIESSSTAGSFPPNAATELAKRLEEVQLTFSARVGEEGKLFGSVTSADIAEQLNSQGFHIEKRLIDLHEPIKALGVYRVPVKLHAEVKPEIRVWVIKQ